MALHDAFIFYAWDYRGLLAERLKRANTKPQGHHTINREGRLYIGVQGKLAGEKWSVRSKGLFTMTAGPPLGLFIL